MAQQGGKSVLPSPSGQTPATGQNLSAPPPGQGAVTLQVDKPSLNNGGQLTVTGTAPAGKPVCLEIYAEKKVRANLFNNKKDKETGKIPYVLYLTDEMPGFYKIIVPKTLQGKLDEIKKEGKKWSFSKALKDLGAEAAYNLPAKVKIDKFQTSILASITGSRGELMPAMDPKENKKRSMQLVKSRFQKCGQGIGSRCRDQSGWYL